MELGLVGGACPAMKTDYAGAGAPTHLTFIEQTIKGVPDWSCVVATRYVKELLAAVRAGASGGQDRATYVMAMAILQSPLYTSADDELRAAVDRALGEPASYSVAPDGIRIALEAIITEVSFRARTGKTWGDEDFAVWTRQLIMAGEIAASVPQRGPE